MDPKRFGIAPKPAVGIMSRSEKRPNYDDLSAVKILSTTGGSFAPEVNFVSEKPNLDRKIKY